MKNPKPSAAQIASFPDHYINVTCPECEVARDVEKVGSGTLLPTGERDAQYRCKNCGGEWSIFFRDGIVQKVKSDHVKDDEDLIDYRLFTQGQIDQKIGDADPDPDIGSVYRIKMDEIIKALNCAFQSTINIDKKTLMTMEDTILRGESVGFLFVKPLDHGLIQEKLRIQRDAIDLIHKIRKFGQDYQDCVTKEKKHEARDLP